jgi:hypothetical protein
MSRTAKEQAEGFEIVKHSMTWTLLARKMAYRLGTALACSEGCPQGNGASFFKSTSIIT